VNKKFISFMIMMGFAVLKDNSRAEVAPRMDEVITALK
jgi:hypothetical protein